MKMFKFLQNCLSGKSKQKLSVKDEIQLTFNRWMIETLQLEESDFRRNHLNRFEIKDGKWFFNDYFDRKINRDAMNNSNKFLRYAKKHEIEIFNSFKKLQQVLN